MLDKPFAGTFAPGLEEAPRLRADAKAAVEASKKTSLPFLEKWRAAPVEQPGLGLAIAITGPSELSAVRAWKFVTGVDAPIVIASPEEIDALLDELRRASPEADEIEFSTPDDDAELRDLAAAEPVVRLCNRLIADAAKRRASDIHIEREERDYRVRFRIDGALADQDSLPVKQGLAAVSRFKILSNLDIAERRRPQDGRFTFPAAGQQIDLRISVTPNVHGESAVLRLLQRNDVELDLATLGLEAAMAERLYRLSDRPHGLLLLTGPTGSGKTTTLYALLSRLAQRDVKILTIEDPVEYRIEGISQTQVNPAIGLTFASALRSFLRHDPDIIMVGEMRDAETARTAVQAALTGHLVLSTLHTNDAPSAVARLLDMGIEDYLVSAALIGVVAQRLVRRRCETCSGNGAKAPACAACGGSGFKGRIAIAELLELDTPMREAIKGMRTATEIAALACQSGFVSMREDGEEKVARGITTEAELLKAIAQ